LKPPAGGLRRVRFFPRGGGAYSIETRRSEETTPPEQVVILNGGVNVLIDGMVEQPGQAPSIGPIDLSADRIVIWTDATAMANFAGGEEIQTQDTPLQIYLEGNIVVRQDRNVLLASQAFYDVREERALLINSEIRAGIAGLPARIRVHAQQLRQLA